MQEREVVEQLPHSPEEQFLIVAIGRVGKQVFMGWNDTSRTNPKWKKVFPDGQHTFSRHGEEHVLRQMQGCNPKKVRIHVYRVRAKDGRMTMARPCKHCQARMRDFGINPKRVTYTDWNGVERKLNKWDELDEQI